MKKAFLVMAGILVATIAFSQSEKYVKAMEKLVPAVDTTWDAAKLVELSNSFERIGEAEKNQWLPYYYAALTRVNAGFSGIDLSDMMSPKTDKTDPITDKATALLNKASELSKNNSEIFIVKKLIHTLHLLGDVMNRYQSDGAASAEALETAKKLNPENPRVYLQEGVDLMNTPEQFGGSKAGGKKILETAIQKYAAFKPESSIHPSWGLSQVHRQLAAK